MPSTLTPDFIALQVVDLGEANRLVGTSRSDLPMKTSMRFTRDSSRQAYRSLLHPPTGFFSFSDPDGHVLTAHQARPSAWDIAADKMIGAT